MLEAGGGFDSDATLNCNDLWFSVLFNRDFKNLTWNLEPEIFHNRRWIETE